MERDIIERGFALACEQHYLVRVGTTPDGRPEYAPTAKGTAQMVGDIMLAFVAQADADGFRDLTAEEKRDLTLHLKNLLDALERS